MSDDFQAQNAPSQVWTDPNQAPPGTSPQGGGSQQLQGRIKYLVNNGKESGVSDDHNLLAELRQVGYQPLGMSADGMTITLQGQQGPYDIAVKDALGQMGHTLEGIMPSNADYDHVDTSLRALIESPAIRHDDSAKEGIIKSRLQRQGIKEPQVVGNGSDWFVFNPGTSQYIALTNKPGMDLTDLGEIGMRAPGVIGGGAGMIMGGAAGAASSFGAAAPLGMAAGSAAGGFVGNRMADAAAMALGGEDFQANAPKFGHQAQEWAGDAGEDALAGLGGAAIGKIAPALLRGGLASRLAEGAGKTARIGGGAVDRVGEFMGKGLPRDIGASFMDPLGMQLPSQAAQLPAAAMRGSAKAAGWVGEQPMANAMAPEVSASLRAYARRALKPRLETTPSPGQKIGAFFRGEAAQGARTGGAEEVGANMGDQLGGRVGKMADDLSSLGKTGERFGYAPYDATIGLARAGGKAAKYGGTALENAAQAVAPMETPMALNYGSEELFNRMRQRRRALQAQGLGRTIDPDTQLVSNP